MCRELAKKGFLPFELKADKRFQEKKDKSLDAKSSKPRYVGLLTLMIALLLYSALFLLLF